MFSLEIIIPIIVVAAVCAVYIILRGRRDERRAREAGEKLRPIPMDDPLVAGGAAMRPAPDAPAPKPAAGAAAPMEPVFNPDAAKPSEESELFEPQSPSDEPPIYRQLEAEEEAQRAADEAEAQAAAQAAEPESGERHPAEPPVDSMIEWILDIAPREGMQFALGGVQSLKLEVDRLQLPLLVRIWAQSSRDGLYYDSGELTGPARHVVAAVVLANRAAQLDDVAASRFFQVLEQSAAQNEVALRREMEPEDAVKRSADLKRFIKYYDRAVEVRIVPRGEAEENFSLDAVGAAASAAGFAAASGRWELRLAVDDIDPVMTLAFGPDQTKSLTLALSLPLANLARGDLKRFFAIANSLSAALNGIWTDCAARPIDAGGAMQIAEKIASQAKLMSAGGVTPASERAKLLFSH